MENVARWCASQRPDVMQVRLELPMPNTKRLGFLPSVILLAIGTPLEGEGRVVSDKRRKLCRSSVQQKVLHAELSERHNNSFKGSAFAPRSKWPSSNSLSQRCKAQPSLNGVIAGSDRSVSGGQCPFLAHHAVSME
jgi:hypothetical protein